AEEAPANGQHHRAMPAHEPCKRSLIAMNDEAPQELSIGHPAIILKKRLAAQVLDEPVQLVGRHGPPLNRGNGLATPVSTNLLVTMRPARRLFPPFSFLRVLLSEGNVRT